MAFQGKEVLIMDRILFNYLCFVIGSYAVAIIIYQRKKMNNCHSRKDTLRICMKIIFHFPLSSLFMT